MSMKLALIVNPVAGGKTASRMLPHLESRLSSLHIDYDLFVSQYSGHLFELARALNAADYHAVAAMGGDGTNYQILNGLIAGTGLADLPPLAIIPAGSGNSFAMDLDILNLEDALAALQRNRPEPVDMISFTQGQGTHYFVNLAGFGFVTDVAATASRFKFFGDLSYVIGIFHRVMNLKFYNLEMNLDGRAMEMKNCFVEICNSRFTGGEMCMAPGAKIDDGLMDIIVVDPLSRLEILSALPKIYKGTHVELPQVHTFQAKEATITTRPAKGMLPDGELFGKTPSQFKIIHHGIRYLK